MEHDKSKFRVTAWPGPIPHPFAPGGEALRQVRLQNRVFVDPERDASWAELGGEESVPTRSVDAEPSERFDEVYLQLMLLDLNDEAAVVSWVNEFGLLEIHEKSIRFPPGGRVHLDNPYLRLQAYPPFDSDELFLVRFIEEADECRRAAGFHGEATERRPYPVTLTEFQWGARCIRDLARSYWCLSTGADPASLNWDSPSFADAVIRTYRANYPMTVPHEVVRSFRASRMENFVTDTLESGLADFSPRLLPAVPDHPFHGSALPHHLKSEVISMMLDASHFTKREVDQGLDLFAVCCLELYNHIAEGAVYRTCANETCGRWFVRHQGRSKYNQRRRTGVKFCSYACARQQTQRNHRRRGTRPAGQRHPGDPRNR